MRRSAMALLRRFRTSFHGQADPRRTPPRERATASLGEIPHLAYSGRYHPAPCSGGCDADGPMDLHQETLHQVGVREIPAQAPIRVQRVRGDPHGGLRPAHRGSPLAHTTIWLPVVPTPVVAIEMRPPVLDSWRAMPELR